jgi:PIN like domain
MRDQFGHFYVPDEDVIATAMQTGLVVPDANVLLSLYRFQSEAREQLFGALGKPGDRLWIPYQVALEFHRNRLTVMSEQEGYFSKTLKELNDTIDVLRTKVRAFRARISLSAESVSEIEEVISRLVDMAGDAVIKAQEVNEVRLDDHASDEVLARIDALFENRVGAPLPADDFEEACKEAERRVDAHIPPGYKDQAKADATGDYLVWRELLDEAKIRKLPVVLVTDDRKEDWYEIYKGRTLGARRELREEMMAVAGVHVLMMTTQSFLLNAEKYLNAEVSQETVEQAKELPAAYLIKSSRGAHSTNFNRWFFSSASSSDANSDPMIIDRVTLDHILALHASESLPEDEQTRRELFEKFLRVPAKGGDSDERGRAARYVSAYIASPEATADETGRGAAWLIVSKLYLKPSTGAPKESEGPDAGRGEA